MPWIKQLVKWLVTAFVVGFVAWEFARQWRQLPSQAWLLNPVWLTVCGLISLAAYLPSLVYWAWCLHRLGQPTSWPAVFRAYFIGHLGKYAPGKAMVPILRAALLYPVQVQPTAAILAVFYETLTCMAAGCFFVAVSFLLLPETSQWTSQLLPQLGKTVSTSPWLSWWVAGGFCLLGIALLIPLFPAGLNRLARWFVQRIDPQSLSGWGRLGYDALAVGLVVGVLNWWLLGLSVWAAVHAMLPVPLTNEVLWHATLSVTVAVVLGFVSLLPGGLGVREGVFAEILATTGLTTPPQAALLAVAFRLVGIVAEVILAFGLVCWNWCRQCFASFAARQFDPIQRRNTCRLAELPDAESCRDKTE